MEYIRFFSLISCKYRFPMSQFRYLNIQILLCVFFCTLKIHAVNPARVCFNNEASDTTTITEILIDAAKQNLPTGERIAYIAKKFIGKPYAPGLLEGDPEMLRVNIDSFDCTTFVETVIAMSNTVAEQRTSWQDFLYNLEKLRYRNGQLNGYGSRLHYMSDWIVDNSHRGILKDVTDRIGPSASVIKTLDFMSANRDKYPALKSETNFEAIKNTEIGYRGHKIPYIKPLNIKKTDLRNGDIIGIVTNIKNLDVTHMGIIVMINGNPHLLHASSSAKKVILDPLPLADYLHRNRSAIGFRVIRPTE